MINKLFVLDNQPWKTGRLAFELKIVIMWDLVHLKSTLCMPMYLFELQNCAQGLHHGVLLVVLYQVGQGVELLASTNIVLQVLLEEEQQEQIRTSLGS